MSAAWTYFIRPRGCDGPVKIGRSDDPQGRLATCQSWSPVPLELAATISGPKSLELRFHARFAGQRSHSEWFHPSVELTQVIAEVAAGRFDVDTLPPPKALRVYPTKEAWAASRRQTNKAA